MSTPDGDPELWDWHNTYLGHRKRVREEEAMTSVRIRFAEATAEQAADVAAAIREAGELEFTAPAGGTVTLAVESAESAA